MRTTNLNYYLILTTTLIALSSSACKFNSSTIDRKTERCGNGVKEASEECDDGNRKDSDGCSRKCTIDTGYTCTETPTSPKSVCRAKQCGDGIATHIEGCDDGNTIDGDGCNSRCEVESGYTCTGIRSICIKAGCGDGRRGADEACDDGNTTSGDGCSQSCDVERGYICNENEEKKSVCHSAGCGDGIVVKGEECDDGNTTGGDGCSATCTLERGYNCADTFERTSCRAVCGDSVVAGNEECDDGNTYDDDGCSANCLIEKGWECKSETKGGISSCLQPCGNLNILRKKLWCKTNSNESDHTENDQSDTATPMEGCAKECDDGNTTSGDGCSSLCYIEEGYSCQPAFMEDPSFTPPTTIYFPITYRSYDANLLESGCVASEHDNGNNGDNSPNLLSPSLSSLYGIPIAKPDRMCEDQESGNAYTTTANPYQFIFTDHSKEHIVSENAWVSQNFFKATLLPNQPAYYFALEFGNNTDPSLIDTSSGQARMFTQTSYLSAVIEVDVRIEANMLGATYNFQSDDDVMIYIDGELTYAEPGSHDAKNSSNIVFFPAHRAKEFKVGSYHSIKIFYMNRGGKGKLIGALPKTIVHLPSLCSKCGNGVIEKGEQCDGRLLEGASGWERKCSDDCKVQSKNSLLNI